MRTLADILSEADKDLDKADQEQKFKAASVSQMRQMLDAIETPIPRQIAVVREHLDNMGEFELYEFLQNCEWWEVRNKNAPGWYRTAAVRPDNGKVEFYYDKDFLDALSKKPGELMFLIAHEASHIFRFHSDRATSQGKDGTLYNVASDMIINNDIMKTPKIGGWDPKQIEGTLTIPDKFNKEFKDQPKAYFSENMYDWINKNKDQLPQQQQQQDQAKDYYAKGGVVRVKSTGEYRKITGKTKDGKIITEPVDIDEYIKNKKTELGYTLRRKK